MSEHLFFLVGFSFMLAHEMDAIRSREWKIFPFLSSLTEARGYITFTILHIPLYVLLLWSLFATGTPINQHVVIGLDIFFMVHIVLHLLRIKHPDHQFHAPFSWALILGAGVAGGLDLLMHL